MNALEKGMNTDKVLPRLLYTGPQITNRITVTHKTKDNIIFLLARVNHQPSPSELHEALANDITAGSR